MHLGPFWPLQNEVREIASVSSDGRTLTFTQPLSFLHYAGPEFAMEVMLLSRNIMLQGSLDTAAKKAGGHVRVESKVSKPAALVYSQVRNCRHRSC